MKYKSSILFGLLIAIAACGPESPSPFSIQDQTPPAPAELAPPDGHDTGIPAPIDNPIEGWWKIDQTASTCNGKAISTSGWGYSEGWYLFNIKTGMGAFEAKFNNTWKLIPFSFKVTPSTNIIPVTAGSPPSFGTVTIYNFQTPQCSIDSIRSTDPSRSTTFGPCSALLAALMIPPTKAIAFDYQLSLPAPLTRPFAGQFAGQPGGQTQPGQFGYSQLSLRSQGMTDVASCSMGIPATSSLLLK